MITVVEVSLQDSLRGMCGNIMSALVHRTTRLEVVRSNMSLLIGPLHKTLNSPEMGPVPWRVRGLPTRIQSPHPIPKSDNLEMGKILKTSLLQEIRG